MAHISRTAKRLEVARPLRTSLHSTKSNYAVIEELILAIENLAKSLQSGVNNMESMSTIAKNLRIHGPQLEIISKDILDRVFVIFRNASQNERLNIMMRLNLLELIELRARGWKDDGTDPYYKIKQATNVEPNVEHLTNNVVLGNNVMTAPNNYGVVCADGSIITMAEFVGVGNANQQQLLLAPGEIVKNSGKFAKPTRIPGKNYCKDEIVIRNADSGKVMGMKGRRVHMIEELSETVISFQRVNPMAKERLVQITGLEEEQIYCAKQLIEDTIRRNTSPVRMEPAGGEIDPALKGDSSSSLTSSNSDDILLTHTTTNVNLPGSGVNLNWASANISQAAAQSSVGVGHKLVTTNSFSNAAIAEAAAGEYKFTCNIGQNVIKITGDCGNLVRTAKLVLDDYFSSAEFLFSRDNGFTFNDKSSLTNDCGVGLNDISTETPNNNNNSVKSIVLGEDDEVFDEVHKLAKSLSHSSSVNRPRRSHFTRRESMPDAAIANKSATNQRSEQIKYTMEQLLLYADNSESWNFPSNWERICKEFPKNIRNKKLGKTMKPFNGKKYWEVYQEEIKKFAIENLEKTTTIEIDNGETI